MVEAQSSDVWVRMWGSSIVEAGVELFRELDIWILCWREILCWRDSRLRFPSEISYYLNDAPGGPRSSSREEHSCRGRSACSFKRFSGPSISTLLRGGGF